MKDLITATLDPILANGGQTMTMISAGENQRRAFAWGGLPRETVELRLLKKRAGIYEALVESVIKPSNQRVKPVDPETYLSTSPWQIYDFDYEQKLKAKQIRLAFAQQKVDIPLPEIKTDHNDYHYRNKMEYAFWWNNDTHQIQLAVYRRGSKGKITIDQGSSLARSAINQAAIRLIDLLNTKQIQARQLKTLLLRTNQTDQVVAQLYVTDPRLATSLSQIDFDILNIFGLEIIYSNPKSPASVISERLASFGEAKLKDKIIGHHFTYAAESFFQINLGVYQLALQDIQEQLLPNLPIVDLYSGVGTIGLSVASQQTQLDLIEINPAAVTAIKQNIHKLGFNQAQAILSASENATSHIRHEANLIVDPPRAGLHKQVIEKINQALPSRVIYLSCNPTTQARDIRLLEHNYQISQVTAYNFFPRTPHVENLVILDRK